MPDDALLERVLAEIQRRGAIGPAPLAGQVAHADTFVHALPAGAASLIDLGSGGGLPGLVLAYRRPDLRVTLIERRAKRVDLLRFGVRTLGLGGSVTVFEGDVRAYAQAMSPSSQVDVVSARSFGPMTMVLETAGPMLHVGGVVLVSEPPDRVTVVPDADLASWGFRDLGVAEGIHRFELFHVEHPAAS